MEMTKRDTVKIQFPFFDVMKRLSALLVLLFVPFQAMAATTFEAGDVVAPAEISKGDVYAVGRDVQFTLPLFGDLVSAGQSISMSQPVEGDVIVAGQHINILTDVEDDVRAAGQTISIDGQIGDHMVLAGQTISLSTQTFVGGDVWLFGETVVVDGTIAGTARIEADTLIMRGTIEGDASLEVGNLELTDDASFGSNLDLAASSTVPSEQVEGVIVFQKIDRVMHGESFEEQVGALMNMAVLVFIIFSLLQAIVVGFILLWLFQKPINRTLTAAKKLGIAHFFLGAAVVVAAPFLLMLVGVTVLGIPFAILGSMFYAGILYFAWLFSPFYLGHLLLPVKRSTKFWGGFLSYGTGLLVLTLLSLIPFVGWIFVLIFYFMSVGLVAHQLWNVFLALRS